METSLPETAKSGAISNVLFKVLAEESPRPTLITNGNVEIIYVNPAWERQFGYALAEVYGESPRIFKSGKTPPLVYKHMWKALKAGKAFQTDQVIDRRKNGRSFSMFSSVFPMHVDGETYYVQILDDITKRKKLEEYQREFIKVAAHDIRSPLAGLQLMSELLVLKVQQHAEDELQADIQSLQEEVVRAGRLVSTLLDISLFESGKVKLRLGQTRLRMLIDEVIEHGRRLAPLQRFSVRPFQDISISADRERIREVLINLLENTIKYASGPQPVIISVASKEGAVVVSVLDRGPGISKKAAARIFHLFYRTDHAKRAKIAGHGLGLHIAQKIIQAHHGHIWVEPRKGGGSVFSFTLPLKRSRPRSEAARGA